MFVDKFVTSEPILQDHQSHPPERHVVHTVGAPGRQFVLSERYIVHSKDARDRSSVHQSASSIVSEVAERVAVVILVNHVL